MLDFSKLNTGNTIDTIINPRDLFGALPNKKGYTYERASQSEVWKQWFEKRNEKNIVIKMNTGSGKTVVGLTILKSSLNEAEGPAVYVVPDKFLEKQVINEAKNLGIAYTADETSNGFRSGKEILICNIFKLVNGKSKFGVGEKSIDIGTIVIDDAHACLETIESQFKINIPNSNSIYKTLLNIFLPSIKEQSQTKGTELENSQPNTIALVPFWAWKNKISDVITLFVKNNSDQSLSFSFPLLKEHLKLCRCVISDKEIEITPHNIPIERITSLETTKRKVFMTATLADDSILSTHFNLNKEQLNNVITPEKVGDIGERMILIPQELNNEITDDELKKYYKDLSKTHNVVIIVPSEYRLKYWKDVASLIIHKDNIETEIEELKINHKGLVVLVNRYDGIDLPNNACRVLVIDGLPNTRKLIDDITETQLLGSNKLINQKIQKIEQGMGRGVRSNDDWCVVFLMGKSLIHHLYSNGAINKFSIATKTQFELSEQIAEQLKNKSLEEIHENAIDIVLKRNTEWVSANKARLTSLIYTPVEVDNFAIAQREAYNQANINQFDKAIAILLEELNKINDEDKIFKGYAKQVLAEYINYKDEVEAQSTLISAVQDNKQLLKPKQGITYEKLTKAVNQATNLKNFLNEKYKTNQNQLIIDIDSMLEDLIFLENTSNKFEEAIKNLGFYLGFDAQRPDNDFKRGPDNLWSIGNNQYLVIECKNGVTNPAINKHDINQLSGSISWFTNEYDYSFNCKGIIIHLGNTCEFGATPHEDSYVMKKDDLEKLKKNIKDFYIGIKNDTNNIDNIKTLLLHYQLTDNDIVKNYTSKISIKSK